ncbi:MAG: ATP-binding protein [Deltaproteobacteria bacterium]|nr:ATP-binding protein [Deltaproteobacteria bacterium]
MNSFPSLVISGPRQSGKSTLLINTLTDYKYITLDDPLTRERAAADPLLFLDTAGEKVILDEIQWAPHLMSYIKMNIDRHREKTGTYVFTGSQQFTLIKNLSDSLAGRIALLDLLPFSVDEKKSAIPLATTIDAFTHAALRSSYPELTTHPDLDAASWYGSYIQTYLERDVRSLYNIGNLRDFQRFLQLLASRCAQLLNLSQFANDLGVSVPTVKSWLSILEAGRIIYLLSPYYANLGKRVTKTPKVYFLDIGLACYLTGVKDREHLLKGPMAGPLFENFCIQETIKLFFNRGRRANLYYLRTNNNLEIDLLIEESFQTLIPIEFKLNKTPNLAMGSNIARFKKLFSRFTIREGRIVSLTDQTIPLSSDITAITLDDYLQQVSAVIT